MYTEDELNAMIGVSSTAELDGIARAYEEGTYPPLVDVQWRGWPALSEDGTLVVSFQEDASTVARLDARAAELGMTRSTYLRALVSRDLERAGA